MSRENPHNTTTAFFDLGGFDYRVIAKQLRSERVAGNKKAPKVEHIEQAITEISLLDTMDGSSTLEITLVDPEFALHEFFDIDRNGKLDTIELNYPDNSPNWWRLTQLSASTAAGQALTLTLTFMERPVVLLLHKRGPKKTKRGKTTRAEFMQGLVQDVTKYPLRFRSKELHKRQRIAGTKPVGDH